MDHKYNVRIYYEDTDAGQVVFYANYFKFTERARTEFIYEKLKLKHLELKAKFDVIFVVKSLSSKYISPAKFEDDLVVVSKIIEKSPVRIVFEQNIEKANKLIFTSTIELAVVSSKGKITKLPDKLLSLI
jgi:acyl-CoA thioester hydrolase|tara:strand:- start:154 stop:543 length:390 start_codon:yes stop_codon:yes gene_type:complete